MLRKKRKLIIYLLLMSMMFSCGPVHRFTRLKTTPREHTSNFCGEKVKAPKNELNKELWVVFSDRNDNPSYVNPGGKVKLKEFQFMDAFLVLRKKGEYYKLIKYDAEVIHDLHNRKLKDRKKVEYCGWIHESRLLLTRQTVTDISSGFKDKQMTIITDSSTLSTPSKFFKNDSIIAYKDENLVNPYVNIPLYNVVYTLKKSADKKNILIAKKTEILPDSAKMDVLGWVPSSLIRDLGQRLYVNLGSLSDSLLYFKSKSQFDTLAISRLDLSESRILNGNIFPLKYNPVTFYKREGIDTVSFRSGITVPIVSNRDNYIFNVNGNKISYEKFNEFETNLRKVNVLFVLQGHERVIQSYSEIANALQNLQPLFEKQDVTSYSYKFSTIITSQGTSAISAPQVKTSGLVDSYTAMMDFFVSEIDSKQNRFPTNTNQAWTGVNEAIKQLNLHKDENNIMVIIGGAGYSEWADSIMVRRIGDANCKILGFQMHGVKENLGNNFVLQIENMIDVSTKRISINKREKLVYTDQIKSKSFFSESSKNVYRLDYPSRSMSQGWILFPEKDSDLPLNLLTNSIDSIVSEVRLDSESIISNLFKAFNTVGNQRSEYGNAFAQYNQIVDVKSLKKDFTREFKNLPAVGYIPTQRINIPDSLNKHNEYHLLLSKDEIDNVIAFMSNLSSIEVDYKYKGKPRVVKKEACNCLEDKDDIDEFKMNLADTLLVSTPTEVEYRSTRGIRRRFQKVYLNELASCKFCNRSNKKLKELTLSEAHRLIIGSPSYTSLLTTYKVKDIRDPKRMSDTELDKLITAIKEKKDNLIKNLSSLDKFDSNGETYYWVDQRMLP